MTMLQNQENRNIGTVFWGVTLVGIVIMILGAVPSLVGSVSGINLDEPVWYYQQAVDNNCSTAYSITGTDFSYDPLNPQQRNQCTALSTPWGGIEQAEWLQGGWYQIRVVLLLIGIVVAVLPFAFALRTQTTPKPFVCGQ